MLMIIKEIKKTKLWNDDNINSTKPIKSIPSGGTYRENTSSYLPSYD